MQCIRITARKGGATGVVLVEVLDHVPFGPNKLPIWASVKLIAREIEILIHITYIVYSQGLDMI